MSLDIQGPSPQVGPTLPAAKLSVPVARPAIKAPKITPGLEPTQADLVEDLLSPMSVRAFAVSIGAHATLLLILAFWYFAPVLASPKVFDTTLAGSPFGDESGDQLKGGLGMDTPLAMPELASGPTLAEVAPAFTSLAVSDVPAPETQAKAKGVAGAANGGGVNITNPGGAGSGDGFGVAKFGQGGENINGVEVKVGDPQFTLIWDSRADIDLHVIEPGGSEIFWENRNGEQGGELDVDDVDGFGPENVNYVQGVGPRGPYKWHVKYYGGLGGINQLTRWKVRVKHAGKIETFQGKFNVIGQKSQTYTLKLGDDAKRGGGSPDPKDTPSGGRIAPQVVASAAQPAVIPVAPAPTGPRVFGPPGSGFSVSLSGEPKADRKDWDTPLGPIVGQTYMHDQTEGGVTITTLDFPASTIAKSDPSKLLDDMAAKAVTDQKGTATKTTKIALAGSAGREVDFTVPDSIVSGGGGGKLRIYLVGSRLIIVSAVGSKSYMSGSDAIDLFQSFKLDATK